MQTQQKKRSLKLSVGSDREKREISRGYLKIPVATIGLFTFMLAQTLGAVWWSGRFSSEVSTKLDFIQKAVENNTKDKYTSTQAHNDNTEIRGLISRNEIVNKEEIAELKTHLQILDKQVNAFISKYSDFLNDLDKKRR